MCAPLAAAALAACSATALPDARQAGASPDQPGQELGPDAPQPAVPRIEFERYRYDRQRIDPAEGK